MLFGYTEAIRKCICEKFAESTDVFVVDSMPAPICKYAGAGRSKIYATSEVQPAFGILPHKEASVLDINSCSL